MSELEGRSVADVLGKISLGSPVAEHDTALANYFIETDTFRRLITNGGDTVAGDKGTGKSALYRILAERYESYPELGSVTVLAAFNPAGTPIFQRLTDAALLDEAEYIRVWKTYFFILGGNWLLEEYGNTRPGSLAELDRVLVEAGLRVAAPEAKNVFSRLLEKFLNPKDLESTLTFTPDGIPISTTKVSFAEPRAADIAQQAFLRHDDALGLLDRCLIETDFEIWMVLDRLDEAFQARPDVEYPALRALFRCYLDMQSLARIDIKLFVRNDLFRRIIANGFVNLTHINARKIPLTWDDDDLHALLVRRLRESKEFLVLAGLEDATDSEVFSAVFPIKVDQGEKRPTTWNWMLTRIRDGNDVKSPRNLVDLVAKAIDAQKRREVRNPRTHQPGEPLITGEALKLALVELSRERVEDTLIAEAGDSAELIRSFEGGKSEHNETSLRDLLGDNAVEETKRLADLGFLERVGSTYKVPPLYRGGLSITQGKAFAVPKS
ncbi:P-loop ATPase, Sll1717 family [Cellulomonas sp. ICMP 17802]|uniref:P-loop ATPase, Sll1717 family n=1 Tax=Cellulomonas sp. ICMP 17802 TaxID=3239199 RepID=UPI00351BAF7C